MISLASPKGECIGTERLVVANGIARIWIATNRYRYGVSFGDYKNKKIWIVVALANLEKAT